MTAAIKKSREGTTLVIDNGRAVTIARDGALSVDLDDIIKGTEVRKQVQRLREYVDSKNYPSHKPKP